jgi:hypothetical protein
LARADSLPQFLSIADCGLAASAASRWHADRRLDQAASLWARGAALREAVERSGYTAGAVSGLHVEGIHAPQGPVLSASTCRVLRDRSLVDMGALERHDVLWVVLASPVALPAPGDEARAARHALELVNRARQSGQRCGTRTVPPADPLRLSTQLSEAAAQHAGDMSKHHYFEHRDPRGHTPADRVRATGYAERRVGENIAYGVLSTEEAIAGWLEQKRRTDRASAAVISLLALGSGTAVFLLTTLVVYTLLALFSGTSFHSDLRVWVIALGVTAGIFVLSMKGRQDERQLRLDPMGYWIFKDILSIGPRLMLEGLRQVRRCGQLGELNVAACAQALAYLAVQNAAVTWQDLIQHCPQLPGPRLREQLSLLDGVLFLGEDAPRVTLMDPFRLRLRWMLDQDRKSGKWHEPARP